MTNCYVSGSGFQHIGLYFYGVPLTICITFIDSTKWMAPWIWCHWSISRFISWHLVVPTLIWEQQLMHCTNYTICHMCDSGMQEVQDRAFMLNYAICHTLWHIAPWLVRAIQQMWPLVKCTLWDLALWPICSLEWMKCHTCTTASIQWQCLKGWFLPEIPLQERCCAISSGFEQIHTRPYIHLLYASYVRLGPQRAKVKLLRHKNGG
jgi:hypothetical protein